MKRKLVSAPGLEPVSLAEAKLHLRVDIDEDDTYISSLVSMARDSIERELGLSMINQTWDLRLGGFGNPPSDSPVARIRIPNPPLVSVTSITYIDVAGSGQVLSSGSYRVLDGTPGEIFPAYGQTWPAARWEPENVVVRYVSGFGAAATDVPPALRHAIKLLVGTGYENRETVITGLMVMEIPSVKRLLAGYSPGNYW